MPQSNMPPRNHPNNTPGLAKFSAPRNADNRPACGIIAADRRSSFFYRTPFAVETYTVFHYRPIEK
jgi:hypothetical protein